jgi:hypothetical protein
VEDRTPQHRPPSPICSVGDGNGENALFPGGCEAWKAGDAETFAKAREGTRTWLTGEWLRPAPMPVTPHVSTPPRPWVEKEEPKIWSILCLRVWVTSSRHRLTQAAAQRGAGGGRPMQVSCEDLAATSYQPAGKCNAMAGALGQAPGKSRSKRA